MKRILLFIFLTLCTSLVHSADGQQATPADEHTKIHAILHVLSKKIEACRKSDPTGQSCKKLEEIFEKYTHLLRTSSETQAP